MDGTILGQGTFTANMSGLTNPNAGNVSVSNANPTVIQIPSNADWVRVYDYSSYGLNGLAGSAYFNGTANAYIGISWYWQRGMAAGTGIVNYKAAASAVISGDTLLTGGFTLYDPSGNPLTSSVATTASTNATRPVVSTGNTAGVSVGTIVRLASTAQTDVNGIDFVVGAVTANTNFTLLTATNPLATAPGAIGGAGTYRIVQFDPLYYPRRRYVVNITQATNAQVSVSVPHQYVPGQAVRFNIPSVSGMIQLNPTSANNYLTCSIVTVVDAYNFTINVDTTGFTAFTWPTIAQQPSSFPEVTPVGENTAVALASTASQTPVDLSGNQIYNTNTGILSDSTVNTGFLGMTLGIGGNGNALTAPIFGPAGSISWSAGNVGTPDTLYWVAGKSTYGGL
jgi:hypothetical protein